MATVTDIMLNLANPDPSIQKPAEAMVAAAKEADLAGFLIACLGELRDEAKPSVARQMAGIVLKNSVALHLKDNAARQELEAKWTALPAAVRTQVKSEVSAAQRARSATSPPTSLATLRVSSFQPRNGPT